MSFGAFSVITYLHLSKAVQVTADRKIHTAYIDGVQSSYVVCEEMVR